jgi:hypothetical protein
MGTWKSSLLSQGFVVNSIYGCIKSVKRTSLNVFLYVSCCSSVLVMFSSSFVLCVQCCKLVIAPLIYSNVYLYFKFDNICAINIITNIGII